MEFCVFGFWSGSGMATQHWLLLGLFLALALAFEFINGFHDTANAVATVIYTKALKARTAVVWSGVCNFLGVYLGGTAVAFSIIHLLPVDLLASVGSGAGMAMVAALLIAAILWNLGTWYLGLPASSSHTLIGAILGIGVSNSLLQGQSLAAGINWEKAFEVLLSLVVSPLVGFLCAALLLRTLQKLIRDERMNRSPNGEERPPRWARAVLIGTCTGVSVAHGSNDGQKGVGLIMLILIALLPARYALDPAYGEGPRAQTLEAAAQFERYWKGRGEGNAELARRAVAASSETRAALEALARPAALSSGDRVRVRSVLVRTARDLKALEDEARELGLTPRDQRSLAEYRDALRVPTDFAPHWVTIAVSCALGLGTMTGWRRIVQTVGEKIGKSHLTYAQGASAEVVAMCTIGLADIAGMPVSTTHVFSSGIAGTMMANRSGVRYDTVQRIALAWVLTMPSAMILSGTLFALLRHWAA